MASFSASNLVAAQARLTEKFTSNEFREKVLPALELGLKNGSPVVPDYVELRKREDRPVYAYSPKRIIGSVGSQRTATHTGARPDSFNVPLTWNTYTSTFSISLKMMDTNVFSFQDALDTALKNAILDIHSQIESDTITNLQTYRTQVVKSSSPLGSRVAWNSTNYAYEIQAGDKSQFFSLAKTVMQKNYYNMQRFDVIVDGNKFADSTWYVNQGTGNYANTQYQFSGMNPVLSTDLSDSNYSNGVSLVMPSEMFCLLPWIPKQNRQGYGDYNSYVGGFGSFVDPMGTGLEFAMHGYSLRTDTSSYNGVAQDVEMQFEVSVDIAFLLSPLSVSNESIVYEFAQL